MPNIFEYFDYHKYLLDFYNERKKIEGFFSYRFMSQRLDIDAGYLVKVLQGKKNIAAATVPKFISLLKLNKKEAKYFELLILFSKAKSNTEIANYFEKMLSFTEMSHTKIESDKYEFYKKWYYSAIREILGFFPFRSNFKQLADMVRPQIKPLEAKRAIKLLERLGLIAKNENGVYTVTSRFVSTGDRWHSIAIRQFQTETLQLALDAIDRIPKEERDISTMTVSLSPESFEELRERLKQFRRQVFELASKEQSADGAYQLNLQLFPLSNRNAGAIV